MYDSVTYQKANAMIKQLEADASKPKAQLQLGKQNTSVEAVVPGDNEDIEMQPVKSQVGEEENQQDDVDKIEGDVDQIIA